MEPPSFLDQKRRLPDHFIRQPTRRMFCAHFKIKDAKDNFQLSGKKP